MSIYRINLGHIWKYKDQVLNIRQEKKEQFESILETGNKLPQGIVTLPNLCLCKQQGNGWS